MTQTSAFGVANLYKKVTTGGGAPLNVVMIMSYMQTRYEEREYRYGGRESSLS